MSEKIKVKMYVHTGFANCKHEDEFEIDRDEWEEMDEKEREKYLDDVAQDYLGNCIDYGAYAEEDE